MEKRTKKKEGPANPNKGPSENATHNIDAKPNVENKILQKIDLFFHFVLKNKNKMNTLDIQTNTMNSNEIMVDTIPVVIPVSTETKTQKKKRKNVENNGIELLVAILLSNETVQTTDQLFALLDQLKESDDLGKLVCDKASMLKCITDLAVKRKMLQKIITNFIKCANTISYSTIDKVYLTGKYATYPEIVELNKDSDKKAAKGDVYAKLLDGTFVGFSVKQSKAATKSNYSVHKLIKNKDDDVKLTKIKKDFLVEKGFPKHDKDKRDEVNALFYCGVENPYWTEMRLVIEKHKDTVIKGLAENLACAKIPYHMYEFDGEHLSHLNDFMFDLKDVSFEECPEYYLDGKGNMRKCAKMFYKLCIHGDDSVVIKTLRTEVRWKGNVHSAAPQFQMHEI